jgi:galactosylceramidase
MNKFQKEILMHFLKHILRETSIGLLLCALLFAPSANGMDKPSASADGTSKAITLDGASKGRVFAGIGAVSAGASSRLLIDYPEPYRSQILDYLFKPNYGASLQHLKVEIGADMNSTDGSEPSHMRTPDDHNYTRGYEWWLMKEALKRNPHIVLDSLPWGAPGWVGKFYSQNTANYVADFLEGAKKHQNLHIAYTGIWNETPFNADYVKILHKTLKQRGIDTEVVCCDEYPGQGKGQWDIVDVMREDPLLYQAVDIVTVHHPHEKGKVISPETAKTIGKPLWSSEDKPDSGPGQVHSREWKVDGRGLAKLYNDNYLEGGFTATEVWSPVSSYYDILAAPGSGLMYANTPWSGHYRVQGAIWATAHTTQFTQPGWQYLDSSSGYLPEKGSYVTLKSTNGKDWSTVLNTIDATNSQKVEFTITGGLSQGVVHIWETNDTKTFEHVADLKPHNGRFSYSFDPDSVYSLTSTIGQSRGNAQPPADTSFPYPYHNNFDTSPLDRSPKYLSDQDGAFEVHPCLDRAGRCLEQVITAVPIAWGPFLPDPWTLTGDKNWTDYQVASDVHLIGGPITIMGHIDAANIFADAKARWPSGYILSLSPDGVWSLFSAKSRVPIHTLASGKVKLSTQQWHHVGLAFHGSEITATLDNHQLATVKDDTHPHGMVGIGTGWNRAQFDNLSVSKKH